MTADQTATLFSGFLREMTPFVHVRFGDADYDWMMGGSGPTCDGEQVREGLGAELCRAWSQLWARPDFYLGDIETFGTPAAQPIREYAAALTATVDRERLVHTEALLIHRLTPALLEFYRRLRFELRPKVLVGARRIAAGAAMLDARFVEVDQTKANAQVNETLEAIECAPWEILLTCCGRLSKLVAGELATRHPERTIIEVGSGLDPLFVGKTRSEQVSMPAARAFFKGLL